MFSFKSTTIRQNFLCIWSLSTPLVSNSTDFNILVGSSWTGLYVVNRFPFNRNNHVFERYLSFKKNKCYSVIVEKFWVKEILKISDKKFLCDEP